MQASSAWRMEPWSAATLSEERLRRHFMSEVSQLVGDD